MKPHRNCKRDQAVFIPHTSSSLQTEGSACGHSTAPFASLTIEPVHAHRTEGYFERRDGDDNGGGDGARTKERKMGTGAETEREQLRGLLLLLLLLIHTFRLVSTAGWERGRDRGRKETSSGDGDEDRIGEGGGEAKKHKKPHNSCRRPVGNGEDLGGKRKNVEKKGLVQ